jgi:ASC-1-like (ASCH) protein
MRHELKIHQKYLMRIVTGAKSFEVRENDRDYQVGDTIHFLPLEDEYNNVYDVRQPLPIYEISYIHVGLGMRDGYAVLAIRETDLPAP